MKHSVKITLVLLGMFVIAQLIGIFVVGVYSPRVEQVQDSSGNVVNVTSYNLPYGMDPPQDISPSTSLFSIIFAIIIAVVAMFFLMKYGATLFLRIWFFAVIALALGITLNAFLSNVVFSSIISLIIAIPVAFVKVFQRSIVLHNASELFVYPGIAAIFVPFLNIWTICLLLIFISLYDIYAVWHSGIMQKMAKYQIKTLRVFSGFFIPYLGRKDRKMIEAKNPSRLKNKKVKVNIAILGGGDVVFPIIMAGVVLQALGLVQALLISLGATLALAYLFYVSEKGKFYPAMPFITIGCFIGLLVAYLI